MARTFHCQICNQTQETAATTGRLPRYCRACAPKLRQHGDRRAARNRTRRQGEKRRRTSSDMFAAGRLAVGLALFNDLETAARWTGFNTSQSQLRACHALALRYYSHVIEGEMEGLDKHLVAVINLLLLSAMQSLEELSPRDSLAAVMRLSSSRDLLSGDCEKAEYAKIKVRVVPLAE